MATGSATCGARGAEGREASQAALREAKGQPKGKARPARPARRRGGERGTVYGAITREVTVSTHINVPHSSARIASITVGIEAARAVEHPCAEDALTLNGVWHHMSLPDVAEGLLVAAHLVALIAKLMADADEDGR